jgi:hypothetical protein
MMAGLACQASDCCFGLFGTYICFTYLVASLAFRMKHPWCVALSGLRNTLGAAPLLGRLTFTYF